MTEACLLAGPRAGISNTPHIGINCRATRLRRFLVISGGDAPTLIDLAWRGMSRGRSMLACVPTQQISPRIDGRNGGQPHICGDDGVRRNNRPKRNPLFYRRALAPKKAGNREADAANYNYSAAERSGRKIRAGVPVACRALKAAWAADGRRPFNLRRPAIHQSRPGSQRASSRISGIPTGVGRQHRHHSSSPDDGAAENRARRLIIMLKRNIGRVAREPDER